VHCRQPHRQRGGSHSLGDSEGYHVRTAMYNIVDVEPFPHGTRCREGIRKISKLIYEITAGHYYA